MMYVDYKFAINENGLVMLDTEPGEIIDINKIPLNEGDHFVLRVGKEGNIMFVKQEVSDTHDW